MPQTSEIRQPSAGTAQLTPISLPSMFERYRDGVQRELISVTSSKAHSLYGMLRYHLGWTDEHFQSLPILAPQGKAIRPTLCLFACEALGGNWRAILPAAVALELIHNFSLIHDDIQDGDLERRHRPTVWALWGQPYALVAGNAMRGLADITYMSLVNRGVNKTRALRGATLLSRSYLEMIEGQCLDLSFEGRMDITLKEYLTMISLKTGALIRCSMELGAILTTEDEDSIAAFGRCGGLLGRAFQIQDDMLGTWGDDETTGKAVGNDIRRKKMSFPIVHALQRSHDDDRGTLKDIYNKASLDDEDVQQVLAILDESGAQLNAQQTTQEMTHLALKEVESLEFPPWAWQEIEGLVEFLNTRRY